MDDQIPAKKPLPLWRRLVDLAGLGLLIAAVYLAIRGADWQAIRGAQGKIWAAAIGLVVVLYLINIALFWLATKPVERIKRVSLLDWVAMLPASGLLNYLPMRVGLIGRIAYMKKLYGIGYRANLLVMLALAMASGGVYLLAGGLTVILGEFSPLWWTLLAAGMVGGAIVGWPLAIWGIELEKGIRPRGLPAWITALYALRFADLLCVALRLLIAAQIVGRPMDFPLALKLAVVCNLAMLVSPVPGGIGIREWLGGLLIQWQGEGQGVVKLEEAAALLLVDRATEVIVTGIGGMAGLAYMRRKMNRNIADFGLRNAD